jgi:predicted esterase
VSNNNLFISGWAGYSELFPSLADRYEFMLPFISHSEREIFDRLDSNRGGTLMAWSVGAHMVLKRWSRVIQNFDRIVLVAPFLSFTDYTSEKVVRLMVRSMRNDAQQVVNLFHNNCGFPGKLTIDSHDIKGLFSGLEYLRSSRAMPSHLGAEKTTILHGEHDRIVNPQASEDIWEIMPKATYTALSYGHWIPEDELASYTN